MVNKLIIVFILTFSSTALAQKKRVIYKYKEYEKFDLGDLEIKGDIITPGDISVKERSRKIFEKNLMKRKNFDQKIIQEIKFLR